MSDTATTSSALHVAHIESNVKFAGAYDLGPRVLVVGDYGSGKTGLCEALLLALTGRSREAGAAGAAIMEMAADGSGELHARARLSDGRELALQVSGTTARASKPAWTGNGAPIAAILTDEVSDLIRREPKAQRRAILRVVCGDLDADKLVRAQLPEGFHALWAEVLACARGSKDVDGEADVLTEAAREVGRRLRETRARAKLASAGERPALPEGLDAARRDLDRLLDAETAQAAAEAAERELPGARASLASLRAQVQTAGGVDPDQARRALALLDQTARVVRAWLDCGDLDAGGVCILCGGVAGRAQYEQTLLDIAGAQAEIQRAVNPAGATLTARIVAAENEVLRLEGALRRRPERTPTGEEPQTVRKRVEALDAQARAVAAWDDAAREAAKARSDTAALRAVEQAADAAVEQALSGRVREFCQRAPAVNGWSLAVQVVDGGKAVCRVGLSREGKFRSWRALSGAERAGLLAVLATAWGAGRPEPVRLVIVDDTFLGSSVDGLLAALAGAVESGALTQAVVCVGGEYRGTAEGWTVIRLAGGE